jgi:hypothetical protein
MQNKTIRFLFQRTTLMSRFFQLPTGLVVCFVMLTGAMPMAAHAHGGIGGFHAGGVHVDGFHAGGIEASGFHAGGFNHVGYYPHYHPGVGYYHPVARAAAWNSAYNNAFGYGGYNPYASQPQVPAAGTGSSSSNGGNGSAGENALKNAAQQAADKLDAELNKSDKDK